MLHHEVLIDNAMVLNAYPLHQPQVRNGIMVVATCLITDEAALRKAFSFIAEVTALAEAIAPRLFLGNQRLGNGQRLIVTVKSH